MRYYLTSTGPMSGAAMDVRAAFRSRAALNRPDAQAQFGLYSWDLADPKGGLERGHGFSAVVNPLHPASQGSVHIHAVDPLAPPTIRANYFADEGDRAIMVAAMRRLRELADTEPLRQLIEVETAPGPEVQADEAILAAVDKAGIAGMHTVGSCRMGSDPASVVDPETRVRGIKGLRVVDASIMPVIPSGNTNAPTMALAWRAADIIQRSWAG
jgi:choline dehydrogenase-like flavoprotein